jgi:hypothetical protein
MPSARSLTKIEPQTCRHRFLRAVFYALAIEWEETGIADL